MAQSVLVVTGQRRQQDHIICKSRDSILRQPITTAALAKSSALNQDVKKGGTFLLLQLTLASVISFSDKMNEQTAERAGSSERLSERRRRCTMIETE